MTIKKIRGATGMTQKDFASYFEIPVRTLQNWEAKHREPASYILKLIQYKVKKEMLDVKKYNLVERNQGEVEVVATGTLDHIVSFLKDNTDKYFDWILEEEPDRELPDFSEVETLRELESILSDYDYDWWRIDVESL